MYDDRRVVEVFWPDPGPPPEPTFVVEMWDRSGEWIEVMESDSLDNAKSAARGIAREMETARVVEVVK